jgi:hypothetical protein
MAADEMWTILNLEGEMCLIIMVGKIVVGWLIQLMLFIIF